MFESKLFWITSAFTAVYVFLRYFLYNYWSRHNIPCEKCAIPLGNISISYLRGKIHFGGLIDSIYQKFKQHPFHGLYFFHKPVICINDPQLIRLILVKDFDRFPDRGWFSNEKVDPLSSQLFLLPGAKWKSLRAKLSPIFTSGKLKQMYPLLLEVSQHMVRTIDSELVSTDTIDVNDILARFTTDVISSIVYGFNSKSLDDPKSEFREKGIKGVQFGGRFNMMLAMFAPEMMSLVNHNIYASDLTQFFMNIFKEAVEYRRQEKIERKDFLNLLMQLMDSGRVEQDGEASEIHPTNTENIVNLSVEEAAAQAFVFFLGGYETTSSTVSFCLMEMALNPQIQERLQAEIDEVAKSPVGITYESIKTMAYLDMVFSETLRKHPSVPILNRVCNQDYPLPNSNFVIPKDMRVIIPVSGIQNNPEFFPEPEKFDPSRFSKENATAMKNYAYLPFGDGGRYCIGKRFALMQAKLSLLTMLYNYTFSISEQTQIPLRYVTENLVQTAENGVKLNVKRRLLTA